LKGARRILVIKHGAFGDMVLATGAFAAIRAHHDRDHLTLLTTPPFESWGRDSGLFDAVELDERSRSPRRTMAVARRLYHGRFEQVYDLQGSQRVSLYRALAWSPRAVRWSRPTARERRMPASERHAAQLHREGITRIPPPDLDFLQGDIGRFGLPPAFALLVAGTATRHPEKRWPWRDFADIARSLSCPVVLVGTAAEADVLRRIAAAAPDAIDLSGKTTLADLATLGRRAALAIGNDTGPMHLLAAVGCPCVVLFTSTGDPRLSAPRGAHVEVCMDARVDDVLRAARRVVP